MADKNYGPIDLEAQGLYVDGWADIVEGMGDKEADIRKTFIEQVYSRKVDDMKFIGAKPIGFSIRTYLVTRVYAGATTIYIGKHGEDLYVSWRTFVKRVFTPLPFIVVGILAAIVGIFFRQRNTSWVISNFQAFIVPFVITFILGIVITLLLGNFLEDHPLGLYFEKIKICNAEDITAMSLTVHKCLIRALDNAGIDVTKLRIKEKFSGGRKGEDI